MELIALKMLFADKAKYFGLVLGIIFATLLMSQQVSIFIGILERTGSQIHDVQEGDIWVMDPELTYIDEIKLMSDSQLTKVRSVEGVQWAVALYKGQTVLRSLDGSISQSLLIGMDDVSLIGHPPRMIMGSLKDIRKPNSIIVDSAGYNFIWPGQKMRLGRIVEINDKRLELVGICDASIPFMTMPLIYSRLSVADQILGSNKIAAFIIAKAAKGQDIEKLSIRIRQKTRLKAVTKTQFQKDTIKHYLERTGIPINFGITVTLGFIIGAIIAGQTFYLFIIENLKQFAALKAIGFTNRQILKMVLLQAATAGAIGYSIGIGLCSSFFQATKDLPALKGFILHWQVALGTFIAVCLIILLSSFISIRKVMVLDPAIVFRG